MSILRAEEGIESGKTMASVGHTISHGRGQSSLSREENEQGEDDDDDDTQDKINRFSSEVS